MAVRKLTWSDAEAERDVLIRVWSPVRFDGGFVSDFEIAGLPELIRYHGFGIDSLDALQQTVKVIRSFLKPHAEQLHWAGQAKTTGFPLTIDLPDDRDEQCRLERLVEDRIERYLERKAKPMLRRMEQRQERMRERYDPDGVPVDVKDCAPDKLIELLRAASQRETFFRTQGNRDAASFFSMKRVPLIVALLNHPNRETLLDALNELTDDNDRPLRLEAARLLPSGRRQTAAYERLRDELVQPESTSARRILDGIEKRAKRRKPWDARDPQSRKSS